MYRKFFSSLLFLCMFALSPVESHDDEEREGCARAVLHGVPPEHAIELEEIQENAQQGRRVQYYTWDHRGVDGCSVCQLVCGLSLVGTFIAGSLHLLGVF